KGIFSWVGFDTKWLEYENVERVAGETKWSVWRLFLYSLDGIVAFSTAPLAVASITGFSFCFIAFVLFLVYIIKALVWGDPVAGFPTLIGIVLLIGGIQLFCIGILGQYLSKTYLETKKRPIYITKEEN
ncbi:MAG: glycosyltransferase, partial [Oscillospiraceae bacterium]